MTVLCKSCPSGSRTWNPATYTALKRALLRYFTHSAIAATLNRCSLKRVVNSSAAVVPETCAQAATVWRQWASVRFLIRRPRGVCAVSGFFLCDYGDGDFLDDGFARRWHLPEVE